MSKRCTNLRFDCGGLNPARWPLLPTCHHKIGRAFRKPTYSIHIKIAQTKQTTVMSKFASDWSVVSIAPTANGRFAKKLIDFLFNVELKSSSLRNIQKTQKIIRCRIQWEASLNNLVALFTHSDKWLSDHFGGETAVTIKSATWRFTFFETLETMIF